MPAAAAGRARTGFSRKTRTALANFKASRADFADCLIGVINDLAGCESTLTFDRTAASLRAFKQV